MFQKMHFSSHMKWSYQNEIFLNVFIFSLLVAYSIFYYDSAPQKVTGNQKNNLHKHAQPHPSKKYSDEKDLGQQHPLNC